MLEILEFYAKAYFRKRLTVINAFLRVFGFVLILVFIGGKEYLPYALVGAFVNMAISPGILQIPIDFNAFYRSKFKDLLVATPVNPIKFTIATAIGFSFSSFVQILVALALIVLFTNSNLRNLAYLLIIFTFSWISFVFLGFYLATKIRDVISAFRVTDTLYIVLTLFSPVYYPIEKLPSFFQKLALLSPTTHMALLMREALNIGSALPWSSAYLFVLFSAFGYLAFRKAEWMES